jgi:predicted amidohydrolase YtcJ
MIEGVGDRGIDFALDVMEAALAAHPVADHRMRVEHCCYVTPPILARLKRGGFVDSSATGFMDELGEAYAANRGQAAMRWMWPHRSLIDAGVPAPAIRTSPSAASEPWTAIGAMVTRRTRAAPTSTRARRSPRARRWTPTPGSAPGRSGRSTRRARWKSASWPTSSCWIATCCAPTPLRRSCAPSPT